MKTPRRIECDVSNNFSYQFSEKKRNKNHLESDYETRSLIAVAGTKHTITTETNKTKNRKGIRKPLQIRFRILFQI